MSNESNTATTAKPGKRGPYKSGIERQKQILEEATQLLIEEGYHNFSIRKVAKRVGLSAGNIQHYFPTRDKLVSDMLESIIANYFVEFDRIEEGTSSPKQYLFKIIQHVVNDLTSEFTTVFFPELWSLANHEPEFDQLVENMYQRYREVYKTIALQINPELSEKQAENFALFLSSSIEGHTMFIGHNKAHTHSCDSIIQMAYNMSITMIESGDIPE
ncbi:TetR/AcrR family transcriptional regulator [Sessilibacter corallicola]|uniref:TetR/AcrR family transcriptional regulator n=1 Tax=Sessilibacter corallicola TaxID=2904075 RepID=UPI001E2C48CD|nr:TetR/AcrR family transcriptional regulator [Sessilibacter corallicola]MCE2026744.1 TetR/AcrR family transcriptional regulator [Sessilibacter corallicola]